MALTKTPIELSSTPSIVDGGNATAITIDSSENVGIGTSSPDRLIDLRTAPAEDWQVRLGANNTDLDTYDIGRDVSDGLLHFYGNQTGYTGYVFDGINGERMRIDASGNLLVGKTVLDNSTVGIRMNATGDASFVADGSRPLVLNRKTSDGDIALFLKDGTTVGSIGTIGGDFVIGSTSGSDAALRMDGTNNQIYPSNATGSARDNAISLGASSVRFKDLYLSGGVYLGGTAAANKLEDYEEGTWTPTFSISSGAVQIFSARYTKIGRQVIINLSMQVTSTVSSGDGILVFTVPFTQFTSGTTDIGVVSIYPDGPNNNTGVLVNNSSGNSTEFAMVFTLAAGYGSGSSINGKLVYETNQ